MERFSNSREHNQLAEALQWRIEMLRIYMPNWNEKKDKNEIKACLAAQKLSNVEGIDYSEYQNSYKRVRGLTATIHDNKEIFEEVFGRDTSMENADIHFIDNMSEAIRMNKIGDIFSMHLYNDKTKKNIPEGMVDEYNRFSVLRDLKKEDEKKKSATQKVEKTINSSEKNNRQLKIPFDWNQGR